MSAIESNGGMDAQGKPSMSQLGHFRPSSVGFARGPLLLRPKSRHSARFLVYEYTPHYFGRFTHAAARCISLFGNGDIAVEALEPRAREWAAGRRAELLGAEVPRSLFSPVRVRRR